jgi:phosphatidylserine/phosphatidylglycerophosphate/cardiolipin synthase-like enzyme
VRYLPLSGLGLAVLLAAGCPRGGGASDDTGDDTAPDATPGDCLTPTSPRSVTPELYVGPTGLEARMIEFIDDAQTSLDLQMYLFTTDTIADAVIAAHDRGVAVRVVLDPDHEGNPDVRGRLQAAGVTTRDAPASYPYAHAKYMIIDGDRAVIQSANFNFTSMAYERNYGIVDRDPRDLADLQRVFDTDWAGTAAPTQPDLSCSRLIVTPVNARSRVVALIASATATLDVEVIYLSDPNVRTAVVDAHARGVAVRVLLASIADYPDNADTVTFLQNAGVPTKVATSLSIHAKMIIADGVVLVGSQNMSNSALIMNREVGVLVFEAAPAAIAIAQFATDWAGAATP